MLADLLFIFFHRKVTKLLLPRSRRKGLSRLLQLRLCVGERNCPISGIKQKKTNMADSRITR